MTDLDFETMNLNELKRLRRDLDKAIASFDQRRKAEAKRVVEAKAREHGFSLAELVAAGSGKSRKGSLVAPKFCNPDNPEQTWSGRGRQPVWYRDKLTAGVDPARLEI